MNLRQLRYFVKVVELGNMTRAAESLFVAQPALGMQIRQLEDDLGVALLVRHSRGVETTHAGEILHERALAILALVEQVREEISTLDRNAAESIRLGLTPMLMLVIGPELVVNVRDRIPKLFLSLVEAMSHVLVDSLVRGDIDLALAYDVPDSPAIVRTALLREDLVLVTLPGPHAGEPISVAEALKQTLALPESGDTVRDLVVRTAGDLGLEPKIGFEVRSVAGIKRLILRGAAAGILPFGSVMDDVRGGKLDARPITSPSLTRTLYLACAARRTHFRNACALEDAIRSSLTGLVDTLGSLVHPLTSDHAAGSAGPSAQSLSSG